MKWRRGISLARWEYIGMFMSQDSLHRALSYLPIHQKCSRCTTFHRTGVNPAKSLIMGNQLTSCDLYALTVMLNTSTRYLETQNKLSVRTAIRHSPDEWHEVWFNWCLFSNVVWFLYSYRIGNTFLNVVGVGVQHIQNLDAYSFQPNQ